MFAKARALRRRLLCRQKPVESIYIRFSAGYNNISGSTPSSIGYPFTINPYQYLTDGINTFSNGFDSKFSQLIRHAHYPVNSLACCIYRPCAQSSISQDLPS